MNHHRKYRQLRRTLRNTPLHESRSALRSKAQVESFAKKFASGLGGIPYDIMDKYYRPEAYTSRDVLTEFGDSSKTSRKGLIIAAALLILLIVSKS